MKRGLVFLVLLVLLAVAPRVRSATNSSPDFKEVYDLLKGNLAGADEKELNRAAIQGLISQLYPRVSIATNGAKKSSEQKLVSKASLFEGPIGYIRIARAGEGLAKSVQAAYHELNTTNKLKGLVFDLRFANGDDYASVVDVADLFCANDQPLLDWGTGMKRSKPKKDALKMSVAVLVNHQTAAAAEALAALLREIGAGLVLGTNTAGQAAITKDFNLKNGEQLRIATSTIRLGGGTTVSMRGVKPDIEVAVSADDERIYLADPFKELLPELTVSNLSSTNSANTNRIRRRISEADLVRARREGSNLDDLADKDGEPEKPEVRDPVLARALDLLKGLAVVRQFKAN